MRCNGNIGAENAPGLRDTRGKIKLTRNKFLAHARWEKGLFLSWHSQIGE